MFHCVNHVQFEWYRECRIFLHPSQRKALRRVFLHKPDLDAKSKTLF